MKTAFEKPGNMLYPVPAVMVGCAAEILTPENGGSPSFRHPNIITVAWAGTVCSDPPMLSISVRPDRYSHALLRDTSVFTVNLPDEDLARALDFCGVRSGREPFSKDFLGRRLSPSANGEAPGKFEACRLKAVPGPLTGAPMIEEAPVSLECRIEKILPLGTHDLFLARILAVYADSRYMDEKGIFHLEDARLIAYSHGKYQALGKVLGTFGWSVRKKKS